jgi:hypothetical protein
MDQHMRGRILASASVTIKRATCATIAFFGIPLWRYLFGAVFILIIPVLLVGCSDARLSPLLGNGAGTAMGSTVGSAGVASFSGIPGNDPGYLVGVQIRN